MPAAGKTNTVRLVKGDRILVLDRGEGRAIESPTKRKDNPVVLTVDRVVPVVVQSYGGRTRNAYDVVGTTPDGRTLTIGGVAGNQTYLLA